MRIARRLLLSVCCVVLAWVLYNRLTFDSVFVLDENRYLLSEMSRCVYTLDTENTVKTNLSGLSNAVIKLEEEGYVYTVNSTENSIDVVLQNEITDTVIRYYYTYPERMVTCFCNVYENSYKGVTYIIE